MLIAGGGCHDHGTSSRDGTIDGPQPDGGNPLTLEIGVTGCRAYDVAGTCGPDAGVGPCCTGAPPLTLSFAPVGSPDLTTFLWKFGDGTPDTMERAPSHAYANPGRYQVTLIGASPETGAIDPPHPLTVVVEALDVGGFCDNDAQCGPGLTCLCAPGSGCSPAFVRGICASGCDEAGCGADAGAVSVCAQVAITPAADGGPGAPAPICVRPCTINNDCGTGAVCEALRAGPGAPGPWTRGCLPVGALHDIGDSCRDASEALQDQSCTTGLCADVGALGVCSAACDDGHPCPDKAACALLSDGQQLCLAACTTDDNCAQDPLLACRQTRPGGAGTGDVMVCAPRACTADSTCAPSGRCRRDIGACVRN
jgi:hypothetical protein